MPPPNPSREPSGDPDAELLAAWVRERREADFTEIVRRHLGLVQGTALRQLGQEYAEDIAQRVFAILARKAADLTDLRSLAAWLHRVTLLQCRSAMRGQIRDRRNQEAAMETARIADGRDPLAEALPFLDAAIGDLPDSDRELILLRYSEGLSFREAAQRTGRKEAALRQQASRALEKLSGMLHRRGVSVPVAALTAGLGVHLAGTSTATAAVLITGAALGSAGAITGISLAGLTFLTMTVKQSIVAGAVLAALVVSGPLAWRAIQIHQAERALAEVTPAPAATVPGGSVDPASMAGNDRPGKTRPAKPLSEADRERMLSAVPGIFESTIKESMSQWFQRDAWMQARRTAKTLGLSEALETDLRDFLIADHAKLIETVGDDDDTRKVDYAARHREQDERLAAWFAEHVTPEQEQQRQRMDEATAQATAANLAKAAVNGIPPETSLSDDQRSALLSAAMAKATRAVEDKGYSSSMSLGFTIVPATQVLPVEERSGDLVRSVLDPEQQEMWTAALQRDHGFIDDTEQKVLGAVLQQIQKVKITAEEIRQATEEK